MALCGLYSGGRKETDDRWYGPSDDHGLGIWAGIRYADQDRAGCDRSGGTCRRWLWPRPDWSYGDSKKRRGYEWDHLQAAIDAAISGYLLDLRKEWSERPYLVVRISQIESRILNISGIVDIKNTSINGAEDNLTLAANEIPVYGGVTDDKRS